MRFPQINGYINCTIIQFKTLSLTMLKYFLLVLIPLLILGQVSPSWLTCPYMETSTIQLITNGLTINSGFYDNLTYDFRSNRTSPSVLVAITDLNFVNQGTMGIFIDINLGRIPLGFTVRYQVLTGTSVTKLNLRYLAYDAGIFGTTIRIQFSNQTTFSNHTGDFVNNNSGTIRTSKQQLAMYQPIDISHNWLCLPYLVGFDGSSTNIYELTTSCSAKTNNTYEFTIKVHNDTNINRLTMYFLMVDQTDLEDTMLYVVESALTRSEKGVQITFFNPSQPIFDNTYLHGLRSFSVFKNVAFNFAVNNTNFTVPSYSNVDQTTHFCLRTRQCNSPYTYYSKPNLLCYQSCPSQTYLVTNYSLCKACHYSCLSCNNANSCLSCNTNFINYTSNSLCTCLPYYYLTSGLKCQPCYYYCQTCIAPGTLFSCQTCEALMSRQLALSGGCECKTGYEDLGVKKCSQICGDGNIYEDPCDDGNKINGDGCSSTCKIEANFTCEVPVGSTASKCYYTGSLSISIARIQRFPYSNTANFYVLIQPYIDLMSSLSTQNTIHSNASLSNKYITSFSPYLVFTGTYSQILQGKKLQISLIPPTTGAFSRISTTTVVFDAISSNGLLLNVQSDLVYQTASQFAKASQIFGYFFIFFSLLFCFTKHRQIGTETFFTIQFMWMCLVFINNLNPMISALGETRFVMGYNGVFGVQKLPYPPRNSLILMKYSTNFEYNFNIMAIIQLFAIIMYLFYRIYMRIYRETYGNDSIVRKIIQIFRFDFFVYWTLINCNQIIFSTVIQTSNINKVGVYIFISICVLSLVFSIASVILFKKDMVSYRSSLYSLSRQKFTFPLVVVGMIVMNFLLLIGVFLIPFVFYLLLIVPIILMIYAIIVKPFRLLANNIRFILNYFILLIVLLMYIAIANMSQSSTLNLPIGIFICMVLVLLMNVGVWIYTIVTQMLDKKQHDMISEINQRQMKELNLKMNEQERSLRQQFKKDKLEEQTHRNISLYKDIQTPRQKLQQKIKRLKKQRSQNKHNEIQQQPNRINSSRKKRTIL